MNPEDVNPDNFKVEAILYNDTEFSIAYGKWEDSANSAIAMRWNGEDGKNGYPNNRLGKPIWFLVSGELTDIILTALLNSKYTNKGNIIKVLSKN